MSYTESLAWMLACSFCRTWSLKLRVCRRCPRLPPPTVLPTWAISHTACRYIYCIYNIYVLLYQIAGCVLHYNLYVSDLMFFPTYKNHIEWKVWRLSLIAVNFLCRIWWPFFQDKTPTCLPNSPTCLGSSLCTSRSAFLCRNILFVWNSLLFSISTVYVFFEKYAPQTFYTVWSNLLKYAVYSGAH